MRSLEELVEGASHIAYELDMLAVVSQRLWRDNLEPVERNAYVESELVHARSLMSFLLAAPRKDDMCPDDFGTGWDPDAVLGKETTARFVETCDYINKRLAHLTWTRTQELTRPETYVGGVFDAMVRFVQHLEAQDAPTAPTFRENYMQALGYLTSREP